MELIGLFVAIYAPFVVLMSFLLCIEKDGESN